MEQLLQKFAGFRPVLYSAAQPDDLEKARVMIIDSVGMLAYLYRYAEIAYIGGGFGVGIHNTLEAATYGIPVVFGPNYERFQEAVELFTLGSGFPVENADGCSKIVEKLMAEPEFYARSAAAAGNYVSENAGAVQRVLEKTRPYLLSD